jgi:hypothetical protein
MKFRLEKCAKICLKSGKVHRKQYMENTMEIEIKVLDSMMAYNEGIQIFDCRREP